MKDNFEMKEIILLYVFKTQKKVAGDIVHSGRFKAKC